MEQITEAPRLEPFKERVAGLRQRLNDARVVLDSISIGAALQQAREVDDERRSRVADALGLEDGDSVTEQAERTARKVAGIKPQLSAGSMMIEEAFRELEDGVERIREAIDRGDYAAGITGLEILEVQLDQRCFRPLEQLKILVQQRIGEGGFREVEVIDLMISALYGAITQRAVREQMLSRDSAPLAPVCWIPSYERRMNGGVPLLTQQFRSAELPFALLPVEDAVLSQPWRHVLAYRHIAAQLYRDLSIDAEMSMLFGQAMPYFSPAALSVIGAARVEIAAESVAVLLGGPAYVGALVELLAHRAEIVSSFGGPAGTIAPYVRWLLACAVLERAGFGREAYLYRNAVERFYGPPEFAARVPAPQPIILELISRLPAFVETILSRPLAGLQGRTLAQFLPVLDQNTWTRVRERADELAGAVQQQGERRTKGAAAKKEEQEPQRKQSNGDAQRDAGSESGKESGAEQQPSNSVPAVILAARMAFERASAEGRDLKELAQTLRGAIRSFAESYYRGPEGKQVQRELNEEEVKRLVHTRGAVVAPEFFGAGRFGQIGMRG